VNHEKLIDDLLAHFDLKNYQNPTAEEISFFTRLGDLRLSMKNGNTEIRTLGTWWVHWRSKNSQMDSVEAFDERDALIRLGYGNGAVAAIDFIASAPERWRLVLPVTLGDYDRDHDTEIMVEWYRKGLHKLLCEFIEENKPQDLVRLWRGLRDQRDRQLFLYKERAFTKRFLEMTAALMANISEHMSRHHADLLGTLEEEEAEE
jgi:hypothetical protein